MLSRSQTRFLLLSLIFLTFAGAVKTAQACSCGPRPTVLDSYDDADVVIITRLLSVEKAQDTEERHYVDGVRSATMVVEKVFKGNLKINDQIVFGQGGGADCIWTFNEKWIGDQFLFYLRTPKKDSDDDFLPFHEPDWWYAVTCGRSTGVEYATDDLLYLKNIDKVRGKTRISGTIGGWPTPPELNVEGKRVKIIGPKKTYVVKTDEHGVFEIYDLPAGKYFVAPEIPYGWKIEPFMLRYSPSVFLSDDDEERDLKTTRQVAVLLEAKKHAGVDIAFEIDNVIRGKVLDPNGKPMSRVCVNVLAPDQEESWGAHDCTDEEGRFEITSISAGQYVLVVNQDGKVSSREPFRKAYYPSASERKGATIITIGPGDVINDLVIAVPKLEETVVVEGRLQYSDDKPATEKWVRFKASNADEKTEGEVSEETDSQGRFSLKILKGLKGTLAAEDWLFEGTYVNCPKVDELIAKSSSKGTTVQSSVINLDALQDFYNLELRFPFPRCEKAKE